MKVSLQSAQNTTSSAITSSGVEEIVRRIGAQLGAVENVINWGARYDGVIIAKVVRCEKHANADKLSVCLIDDGGIIAGLDRNEDNLVQVVCGAPNVRAGLTVAWLPPGSTVPSTYGDAEPFVLGRRELRGVVSNGMIASASELGISDDHSGILEITEDVAPGTLFNTLFGLDDYIIDLENKMFTHRPDCFGTIGVARELAGIQHVPYVSPAWYMNEPVFDAANTLTLTVGSETPLVPRFSAIVMQNITVGPSPTWLQVELVKAGIRPINNIVDITNWLMHTTAQPLHAYDYDKIVAVSGAGTAKLMARQSKKGEQLALLNGKTLQFEDDSVVLICAGDTPVGIGGVMGGADTEVNSSTKTIIIEAASFNMYNIRKTSMKYGLFTDAVTRFNKGQSPLQTTRVLKKAVDMTNELAGGVVASTLADYKHESVQPLPNICVTAKFINERLGSSLDAGEMKQLLNNVECPVIINGDELNVTVPFWRRDLHIAEDIVEEIGRLYGYDKLPVTLPPRSSSATPKNALREYKIRIKDMLSAAGANEVLSYSFGHKKVLEAANQDVENALQLSNAVSPDLQYFRLSIIPSLLDKVHMNVKAGNGVFAIYEVGRAHSKKRLDNDGLPIVAQRLALVFAADAKQQKQYEGEPYYQARVYVDMLVSKLGVAVQYEPFSDDNAAITSSDTAKPFLPARSAVVRAKGGEMIGTIGEFTAATAKAFKLPEYCAGFELELEQLFVAAQNAGSVYVQLPKFPNVSQDITIAAPSTVSFGQILQSLNDGIKSNCPEHSHYELVPLDIYTDDKGISYSFRLIIGNHNRTMAAKEVNDLLDKAAAVVAKKYTTARK